MICLREAGPSDWSFVLELMMSTLAEYYGGDHASHAKRIFDTHISGGQDKIGFFSQQQKMFIAEHDGCPVGMIHLVLKRQSTCKISPLIVNKDYRKGGGVGVALLERAFDFANQYQCRQIYCTVSKKNNDALRFFMRNGFIIAGKSKNQYMDGIDEFMLYKNLFDFIGDDEFDIDHISVLPMIDRHRDQVRMILLDNLSEDFIGIDDTWVDSLFAGFDRRGTRNVDDKYKLLYTAVDRHDRVLGIAGATPKKGEPIKLMPFVSVESPAFFALLSDVPGLLQEYGRKVYVHIIPDAEQTRFLQKAGWRLDGVMPDAYQVDRVTQQWSKELDRDEIMKQMRLKKRYLDMMRAGKKTLEVRVGYESIKSIKPGEQIAFLSRDDRIVREVKSVRKYPNFKEMMETEDHTKIVPDMNKIEVERLLREIYPSNKEELGVVVLQVG
jgi:ASC-1-like (ASCH) protein/GNAT superfamily N-acetyltransferase